MSAIEGADPFRVRRPMRSLRIAASGLSAQRARLDAIAMNIANAETTRTPEGGPYRRITVELEEAGFPAILTGMSPLAQPMGERLRLEGFHGESPAGVRVAGAAEDPSEGQLVYDPGHPDANDDGYVRMPNVSITQEMVDMMDARRVFEANASVFEAVKSMLRQAAQL